MVSSYDDHARLTDIIKRGEPQYVALEGFWKERIAPEEDRRIAKWERQYAKWHPFKRLEQLERIKFPFSSVNVDVIDLDPSGSSMQGAPDDLHCLQLNPRHRMGHRARRHAHGARPKRGELDKATRRGGGDPADESTRRQRV
jgi:hypothetical protein